MKNGRSDFFIGIGDLVLGIRRLDCYILRYSETVWFRK